MDTSDWIALAAFVVAVAAAVFARQAVVQARRSADEAARSNEIDEDRRREEREKRHEDLAPEMPGEIDASFRPNRRLGGGHGSLFGTIKVPRGYRVKAEAVTTARSRTELSLGMVVPPDREVEFQIEPWHPEQGAPRTEEIVFRFWPPVEGADDVPSWSCGCGRPGGATLDGAGHWERRVKVTFRRPQVRFI